MDFQQFYENWVETQIDNHSLKEAYQYVLFPPGKLFRPLLFLNLLEDNGLNPQDYYETAVGLELHHSYTLVHDDLPCMDDDDMRRGRPSAHKKFNEWKAILIGDGLLNLSYQAFDSRLVKPFSMLLGLMDLFRDKFLI
jgi:geranylgeranyl pyrophosphate synthase